MSVYGTRHFGKVCIVPNLLYVATKFFHINFVPLIPLGSSVIIANSEQHRGNQTIFLAKQIEFSWKSFFMAYLRFILWISLLVSAFMFAISLLHFLQAQGIVGGRLSRPVSMEQLKTEVAEYATVAVASGFFLYLTFRTATASEERAIELGRLLGFPETTVREHLYGQGAKQYAWQCPSCGALNRTAEQGTGTCVRCGGVFVQRSKLARTLLVLLLAALFVAAVAYFIEFRK